MHKAGIIILILTITALLIAGCGGVGNSESLSTLAESVVITDYTNVPIAVISGDVYGTAEDELVAVSNSAVRIYDFDGKLIAEKSFEDMNFNSTLLADVDNDSKNDIILGVGGYKGARIIALSGLLELLFDFTAFEAYNAETSLHFVDNGSLYFSMVSSIGVPPKIVGALELKTQELRWHKEISPIPNKITPGRSTDLLAVSNAPKPMNTLPAFGTDPPASSGFRSAILLIDSKGNERLNIPLGPDYFVGKIQNEGISSLETQLIDLDGDEEEEIITAINRISDFYTGNASIEIRNIQGELLNRREFSPRTEIEFAAFTSDKMDLIITLQKQKGKIMILDNKLETKCEWQYPHIMGEGILHQYGDFNGDGKTEFLISIDNTLFIFNSELNPLYSTAFDTFITDALFSYASSRLVILTDKIYIMNPSEKGEGTVSIFTNPPGAQIFIDGKLIEPSVSGVIRNINPQTYSFKASIGAKESEEIEVDIRKGEHKRIELTVLARKVENKSTSVLNSPDLSTYRIKEEYKIPEGSDLLSVGKHDIAGDEVTDLIFYRKVDNLVTICNTEMQTLSRFKIQKGCRFTNLSLALPDSNSDGKAELLFYSKHEPVYRQVYADGRTAVFSRLGHFQNSALRNHPKILHNQLFWSISSGYPSQPRGILGLRTDSSRIDFFLPTAAVPIDILLTEDRKLISHQHTPGNDGAITYPNGMTAYDSNYFITISDTRGNLLNQSSNPKINHNDGILRVYEFDMDSDGKQEIYILTSKDNYYTGPSELYRLDISTGGLEGPLFSVGMNNTTRLTHDLQHNGKAMIAVQTSKPLKVYLLNENFDQVGYFEPSTNGFLDRFQTHPDIDGDGNSEYILFRHDGAYLFNLENELQTEFILNKDHGKLRRFYFTDMDQDGNAEAVISTDTNVVIYGL